MFLNEEMKTEDMIKNQNFVGFFLVDGQLPYLIDIPTDLYIFEVPIDLEGEYDSHNSKRKILFTSCQKWIEGQKVAAIKSVLSYNFREHSYTNIISKYKVCIELFEDEIDTILIEKNLEKSVKKIYQTILSFLSIKYNQIKLGNDCINISIEDSGAPQIMLYKREYNQYKLLNGLIIPSFSSNKNIKHSELDFNYFLSSADIVWLYYFNMAIYSFDRQDYLNTIIYCAISLESYLNYLIEKNNLHDKYDQYNDDLKIKDKIPGFFTSCKFLENNNIIDSNLNKKLKECYGGLSTQRNAIVHGNITNILLNSSISKIGVNKLNEIYSNNEKELVK